MLIFRPIHQAFEPDLWIYFILITKSRIILWWTVVWSEHYDATHNTRMGQNRLHFPVCRRWPKWSSGLKPVYNKQPFRVQIPVQIQVMLIRSSIFHQNKRLCCYWMFALDFKCEHYFLANFLFFWFIIFHSIYFAQAQKK